MVLISGFSSISVCLTVCGDDPSTTSLLRTLNMKQDGGTTEHRSLWECREMAEIAEMVEVYGSILGSTLGEVYGSMMGVYTPYSIPPHSVFMGVHWE